MKSVFAETPVRRAVRAVLLSMLVIFSIAAISFSFYVLFGDVNRVRDASPAEERGMFTVFVYRYINEVHPAPPSLGSEWSVANIEFKSKNFAVVEAADGTTRTKLEFVYTVEPPNVRVLRIHNITGQDQQDAQLALIYFFNFLHEENFDSAATLYGGPLSRLQPYGVGSDVATLLRGYCAVIGGCPLFRVMGASQDATTGIYRFAVTYLADDGAVIEATATDALVENKGADGFLVLTLPLE